MKLYEFDENRFSIYAVIYANNEAEATRFYLNNIYGAEAKYNVPKALDIDEFYEAFSKKHTDLDSYELKTDFGNTCYYMLSQKAVKRVM